MYKSLPPPGAALPPPNDSSMREGDSEIDDNVDWKAIYLRAHTIEHHWRCGEVKPPKVCPLRLSSIKGDSH